MIRGGLVKQHESKGSMSLNAYNIRRSRSYNVLIFKITKGLITQKNRCKQGVYMERIKFEKYEKIKVKNYNMYEISGNRVNDDSYFKTRIFPSAKDMAIVVTEASPGDVIAITMKANGEYMNPVKMVNETKLGLVPTDTKKQENIQTVAPVNNKNEDAKIACKFYIDALSTGMEESKIGDAFHNALNLADMVDDWRKQEGSFKFNADADIPSGEDYKDNGEDDIPF